MCRLMRRLKTGRLRRDLAFFSGFRGSSTKGVLEARRGGSQAVWFWWQRRMDGDRPPYHSWRDGVARSVSNRRARMPNRRLTQFTHLLHRTWLPDPLNQPYQAQG